MDFGIVRTMKLSIFPFHGLDRSKRLPIFSLKPDSVGEKGGKVKKETMWELAHCSRTLAWVKTKSRRKAD